MKIITVSGSGSGSGKTTLAVELIRRLRGFAAIKAGVTGLYSAVTDDPGAIGSEGKDTAAMKAAGAAKVVLVMSTREGMADSLKQAMGMAAGAAGVIIEGNSAARLMSPDAAFFVTGEDAPGEDDRCADLMARADVVVVNTDAGEVGQETERAIRSANPAAAITTMGQVKSGSPELDGLIAKVG